MDIMERIKRLLEEADERQLNLILKFIQHLLHKD